MKKHKKQIFSIKKTLALCGVLSLLIPISGLLTLARSFYAFSNPRIVCWCSGMPKNTCNCGIKCHPNQEIATSTKECRENQSKPSGEMLKRSICCSQFKHIIDLLSLKYCIPQVTTEILLLIIGWNSSKDHRYRNTFLSVLDKPPNRPRFL